MKFPTRFFCGAFLTLLFLAPKAEAQVVVYKLEFKKTGTGINYTFYDAGYVIAPAAGGAPSYLFTFRDETGKNKFTKFVDFGEYFMAISPSERRAVLAADSDSTVNLFALQAVGEPNVRLRIDSSGFVATVDTALTLEGFVLSSDDESELPFDSSVGNLGYAGASIVKGSLQRERTEKANRALQSVADALADLEAELNRKGFTEFELATGDADAAGDGTATGDGASTAEEGTDATGTGTGRTGTGDEVVFPAVPVP